MKHWKWCFERRIYHIDMEWTVFPQRSKNPRARFNLKSWLDRCCWTYFGQVQTLSNHIVVCILTPFINNYVMRFYYIILYYIISYSSYIPINGPQNDLFYIPSLNFGETSWSLGRPWAHGLALRWTSAHAPSTCRVLEEIHGKWNGKMGCIKHISLKQKTCWTN